MNPQFSEEDIVFLEPETAKLSLIVMGDKGSGKTMFTITQLQGSKLIFSYDGQTLPVAAMAGDKNVRVIDGLKYIDFADEKTFTETSAKCYDYIVYVLETLIKKDQKFDYVIHDAIEPLIEMCEMKMRKTHGFTAFQGIDFSYWKDRKLNIRRVHRLSSQIATKGVVYTTYTEYIDRVIQDFKVKEKSEQPAWIDIIKSETNCVIKVYTTKVKELGLRFNAEVVASRHPAFVTGQTIDFTVERLLQAKQSAQKSKLDRLFED